MVITSDEELRNKIKSLIIRANFCGFTLQLQKYDPNIHMFNVWKHTDFPTWNYVLCLPWPCLKYEYSYETIPIRRKDGVAFSDLIIKPSMITFTALERKPNTEKPVFYIVINYAYGAGKPIIEI